MRLSFSTICLFLIVTVAHFAVVAGVTRLGDGPAQFLSTVDSEAILENWLSPKTDPQPAIEDPQPAIEDPQPAIEIANVTEETPSNSTESTQLEDDPMELEIVDASGSETTEKTAETEDYSAIVDARLLAGRIEAPNPGDYFRDATARRRDDNETLKKIETPAAPPTEPAAKEKAVSTTPKKETPTKVQASPGPSGPHKIRGIRPLNQ